MVTRRMRWPTQPAFRTARGDITDRSEDLGPGSAMTGKQKLSDVARDSVQIPEMIPVIKHVGPSMRDIYTAGGNITDGSYRFNSAIKGEGGRRG